MILTGSGELAFCAGADLKALAQVGENPPEEMISAYVDRPEGPMGFTRLTPGKPTIAAISGWCLAGGLELALWCDLRIAAKGSRLGYPERRWGVPLIDGGTQRLPRIVGLGRALDLILTGRIMEVDEAHRWGLVNEIVPPGGHLERALELAEGLARFPQETMLADRRAAIRGSTMDLEDGLAYEARAGREVLDVAIRGASRFAGGEGRGGEGAGA
jgi:enoyl-CoA hydratase